MHPVRAILLYVPMFTTVDLAALFSEFYLVLMTLQNTLGPSWLWRWRRTCGRMVKGLQDRLKMRKLALGNDILEHMLRFSI